MSHNSRSKSLQRRRSKGQAVDGERETVAGHFRAAVWRRKAGKKAEFPELVCGGLALEWARKVEICGPNWAAGKAREWRRARRLGGVPSWSLQAAESVQERRLFVGAVWLPKARDSLRRRRALANGATTKCLGGVFSQLLLAFSRLFFLACRPSFVVCLLLFALCCLLLVARCELVFVSVSDCV